MKSYFDEVGLEWNALRVAWREMTVPPHLLNRSLEELETRVVYDVTIAEETPGFPRDLRDQIDDLVRRFGVKTTNPAKFFGATEDELDSLGALFSHLHEVFCDLSKRGLPSFSDDPRRPLQLVYATAQKRRSHLARLAVAGRGSSDREAIPLVNIVLTSYGPDKIQAIKAVRELTGLGLKEAKDLVEADRGVIREGAWPALAAEYRRVLARAGATVEFDPVVVDGTSVP